MTETQPQNGTVASSSDMICETHTMRHDTNMTEDIMFKSLIKPKSVPLVYLAVKTGKNASIMNKMLNSCQKRERTHFDMPTYFI